jgi:hypothetical protein
MARRFSLEIDTRSYIAAPILTGPKVLGLVTTGMTGTLRRICSSSGVSFFEAFTGRCTLATKNVRLYRAELHARTAAERAVRHTEQLQETTAALTNMQSVEDVIQACLPLEYQHLEY